MRRMVPDTKDKEMSVDTASSVSTDIDLKELLDKCRLILQREIRNISSESTNGRLSKDASQSLVNYIKLLKDLIKDENEFFSNISDEELEKLLNNKS